MQGWATLSATTSLPGMCLTKPVTSAFVPTQSVMIILSEDGLPFTWFRKQSSHFKHSAPLPFPYPLVDSFPWSTGNVLYPAESARCPCGCREHFLQSAWVFCTFYFLVAAFLVTSSWPFPTHGQKRPPVFPLILFIIINGFVFIPH